MPLPAPLSRRRLLAWLASGLPAAGIAGLGGVAPGVRAQARREVRLAFIDPLSGPAGDIGRNSLRSWQFLAEKLGGNAHPAGLQLRVAGFDNKASPQESLNALKAAIDHGFRYIVQGNGSGVSAALSEAIVRHNGRFPRQQVLLINYAAMDPALTSERCTPWHFRVDADTAMKMRAMTRFIAGHTEWRRIYLINQNYAHGQQFSRWFRTEMAHQSAYVEVVGDELHPPFARQDFGPYVDRCLASGAQALATGNWGVDMLGLVKALHQRGARIPLFGYYPSLNGTPAALAAGGERLPVYQVATGHTNLPGPMRPLAAEFRRRYGEDLVVHAAYDGVRMLLQAMHDAASTDVERVGVRLENLVFEGFNGPVRMRAQDHQLQTGLFISRWQHTDAAHPVGAEGTDYTFAPVAYLAPEQASVGTACRMLRV